MPNNFIYKFLFEGHPRSVKIKKNLIASYVFQGIDFLIGFMLVPMVLHYLDVTHYGVWLTISSIIGWLNVIDIGLGNGLRNKLAVALSEKDYERARAYISTAYVVLAGLIGVFYCLFLFLNQWLDWSMILNTKPELADTLHAVILIVITFFSLNFVLRIMAIIFIADQLPAYSNGVKTFNGVLIFLSIYVLTRYFPAGDLIHISLVYSVSPVILLFLVSLYFYTKKYSFLRPSLRKVRVRYLDVISTMGLKFFLLQLVVVVILTTDNLIITQLLGPAAVTPYNIALKYFSIPIVFFNLFLNPYWSAFTEAVAHDDILWAKTSINRLILLWSSLFLVILVMLAGAKHFYHFWVGSEITIPLLMSVCMALNVLIVTWNNIFIAFINGVGKIQLQLYSSILMTVLNIPVSIFFARNMAMGGSGVILGTSVCLLSNAILMPIQYNKIINNRATGIWSR